MHAQAELLFVARFIGLAQCRHIAPRQLVRRQRDDDLVPLAEVTHLDRTADLDRLLRSRRNDRARRLGHFAEQPVGSGRIEAVVPQRERARELVGDRRAQEAEGRTDACVFGN